MKRIDWLDSLRGFAMLLVVIGHVSSVPDTLGKWIYSFHMPLFFIISGVIFQYEKYANLKECVIDKAKKLLIPYTMLFIVNIPFWYLNWKILGNSKVTATDILIGFITANQDIGTLSSGALWFLPCLFLTSIVFWLLIRLDQTKKLNLAASIISCFIIAWFLSTFTDARTIWCWATVPMATVFLWIGWTFGQNLERFNNFFTSPAVPVPVNSANPANFVSSANPTNFNNHVNSKNLFVIPTNRTDLAEVKTNLSTGFTESKTSSNTDFMEPKTNSGINSTEMKETPAIESTELTTSSSMSSTELEATLAVESKEPKTGSGISSAELKTIPSADSIDPQTTQIAGSTDPNTTPTTPVVKSTEPKTTPAIESTDLEVTSVSESTELKTTSVPDSAEPKPSPTSESTELKVASSTEPAGLAKLGNTLNPPTANGKFIALAIAALAIGTWIAMENQRISMYANEYKTIAFALVSSLGLSLGFAMLFMKLPKIWVFDYAGKNSLAFFGFHIAVLRFFQNWHYTEEFTDHHALWIGIIVFLLLIPITMLVNKFCPFIVGKKYPKRDNPNTQKKRYKQLEK